MYDWANSAFWSTIVTAVFPAFFASYAAAGLSGVEATSRFAWGTTIALTVVALTAPVLGALADHRPLKKRLLFVFLLIGVAATLLMATIGRGQWVYALVLFMVANVGVASTLVFYDSLLPHLAAPDQIDGSSGCDVRPLVPASRPLKREYPRSMRNPRMLFCDCHPIGTLTSKPDL